MKILVAAPGFDSREKHEVSIFALDQAKALRDAGHDVRFAAIDTRSIRRFRPWGLYRYKLDGIPVYYSSIPCGTLPLNLPALTGRMAASKICRTIAKDGWKPDIVHAHFLGVAVIVAPVCWENGLPLVITEHTSAINSPNPGTALVKTMRKTYPLADALLAVSSLLANNIYLSTGARARVVPNIIDTQNFCAVRVRKNCAEDGSFCFAASGFLIERKGYDLLLRAVGELHRKGYALTLTIFGDGAERENLEKQAEVESIRDFVDFRGQCSRKELGEAYAQMDAFVLPSRRETFGVVYIEAMAVGLPVIATRCGGPEDFVTEENGILIPVDDVQALTDAMEYMILHRNEYNSTKISENTRRQFAPETIAAQLTEVYKEVLSC